MPSGAVTPSKPQILMKCAARLGVAAPVGVMVQLQDGRGRPAAQGLRHDVCCSRECRHYPVSSAAGDRDAVRVEQVCGDIKLWHLIVDNPLMRILKIDV